MAIASPARWKAMDAPLLCKGNDSPLTDVGIA
jgi:hypothetical protein